MTSQTMGLHVAIAGLAMAGGFATAGLAQAQSAPDQTVPGVDINLEQKPGGLRTDPTAGPRPAAPAPAEAKKSNEGYISAKGGGAIVADPACVAPRVWNVTARACEDPPAKGKNHQSSRSNISQKPGFPVAIAGVTMSLAPFEAPRAGAIGHVDHGKTTRRGTVVFRGVPVGDHRITISPRQQGSVLLDGLTVRGALVLCDADQQTEPAALICSIRVQGRAPSDVTLGLIAINPEDAPAPPVASRSR